MEGIVKLCTERKVPFGLRVGLQSKVGVPSKQKHKRLTITCLLMCHGESALDQAQLLVEKHPDEDQELEGYEQVLEQVDALMEQECEACQAQYQLDRMFVEGKSDELMAEETWYTTLLEWKAILQKHPYCQSVEECFYPEPHKVDDIMQMVEALHNQPEDFVFQMRYRNHQGQWKYFIKGQGAPVNLLSLVV